MIPILWPDPKIFEVAPKITPVFGNELLINGNMELFTAGLADSWTIYKTGGTATPSQDASPFEGLSDQKIVTSSGAAVRIYQVVTTVVGQWYQLSYAVKLSIPPYTYNPMLRNGTDPGTGTILTQGIVKPDLVWAQYFEATRAIGTGSHVSCLISNGSVSAYLDAVSLKELILRSLFYSRDRHTIAGVYSVRAKIVAGNGGGLALCLNSSQNPTAGIVVYHDGTNLCIDKFTTAVTWTNILKTPTAYIENAPVKASVLVAPGHVYVTAFYNGFSVGLQQDITDAAIISNTNHGLFSTNVNNRLAQYSVMPPF
jgi:hypothetical protein